MTDAAPVPETRLDYWKGVGLAFAADFLVPWVSWSVIWIASYPFQRFGMARVLDALAPVGGLLFLGIGVSQWLWLYPLARHYRAKGRFETAKGVVTGGGLVFLINAGCWGIFGGLLLRGTRFAG